MSFLIKKTIKIVSYSALLVAGLVINAQVHSEKEKTTRVVGNSLNSELLSGVAHADLVGGGGYGAAAGSAAGGGGDCGDGGDGACDGG